MSGTVAVLSSLISTYLTTYVDTGNRALDTSIISAAMICLGGFISVIAAYFANDANKNRLIACVRRQKGPRGFNASHYYLPPYDALGSLEPVTAKVSYFQRRNLPLIELSTDWIGKNEPIKGRCDITSTDYMKEIGFTLKNKISYELGNTVCIPVYLYKGHIVFITGFGDYDTRSFISLDRHAAKMAALDFVEEYNQRDAVAKQRESNKEQKLYEVSGVVHQTRTELVKYQTGIINPKRTFDTLFYDQKPLLMNVLQRFKDNCMYPKGISMDNKLGILLHGPPGTGKTGTISAIANMLGRDVINVNMTNVLLSGGLDEMMKREFYTNHILVLDEFDHMIRASLEPPQEASPAPEQPTKDWASLLAVAEGEERKEILKIMGDSLRKDKTRKAMDFGYLLQKMDGLECASGRIMIFCTNDPDALEQTYPALFRPGRIDLKLRLGYCSQQMYEDILATALELDDDGRAAVRNAKLTAGVWSPLQVINFALIHKDLGKTLEVLKSEMKKVE